MGGGGSEDPETWGSGLPEFSLWVPHLQWALCSPCGEGCVSLRNRQVRGQSGPEVEGPGSPAPVCRWAARTAANLCAWDLPPSLYLCPLLHWPSLTPGHAEQPHCLSDPVWPPQAGCPPENSGAPLGTSTPCLSAPWKCASHPAQQASVCHTVGFLGRFASVEGLLDVRKWGLGWVFCVG